MKLDCPHCDASVDAADGLDATAEVNCPKCRSSFTVASVSSKPATSDDADVGFELDDLMSYSGVGTVASLEAESTATSSPEEGFIASDTKGADEGTMSPFETSFDEAVSEMSAIGFDEANPERTGEVSHLRDVDLTMIGTYHRTGRKLHHATDVVWTGRETSADYEPVSSPIQEVRKGSSTKSDPPVNRGTSDSIDPGFDDFTSFTSAQPPEVAAAENPAADDSKGIETGGASGVEIADELDSPDKSNEGAGDKLEEMDFSSLLEDSLTGKSLFGQDSNPFVDVGLASESLTGAGEFSALGDLDLDSEPGSANEAYDSSAETKTFFVDAPSVEDEALESDLSGGALDARSALDIDVGSQVGPLPGSPLSTESVSSSAISKGNGKAGGQSAEKKRSSAPLLVLLLLLVVAGTGVAGEFTGNGWFFMNLVLEPEQPPVRGADTQLADAKPPEAEQAGGADVAKKSIPTAVGLADTPSAYRAKIGDLEEELKTAKDDTAKAEITNKLIILQTMFLYRWPARMHHDNAMQTRLQTLKDGRKSQSFHSQFWETFQQALDESDKDKRAVGLKNAEVALAKVNFTVLPPESNLLYKALLFEARGQESDALPLVELALSKNPQSQWATYEKARLQLDSNKLDESAATVQQLVALNPEHPDASVLKVNIAIARQAPDAYAKAAATATALQERMKAKQDAYGEYQANLLRARIFGLQNDLKQRLEALEAASSFDPRNETLLLELADTDIRTGNSTKAAERLKACDPAICTSLRYFRTYIKVLLTDHKLMEAESVASKAETAHPESADILFAAANVHEQRGKVRSAAKKYAQAIEIDPKYLEAYLRLAGIHRRSKTYAKAIAVLNAASKVFEGAGKDSEAALSLELERAELLVQRGRKDDARKIFASIVQERPNDSEARLRLATLHVDLGAAAKAVEEFERILRQGKTGNEVSIPFAEALLQSGKPDRAIEELKSYLESSQNDLKALVKLGHAYVMKQRYEEAMAVLEHAVAINRNYAPAYFYAGLAEFGRQRQKARDVERRLRSGEPVRAENRPDFRKAIRALNNAREKAPDNYEYRRMLAEALTESGRQRDLQSALEQYDSIIKSYKKSIRLGRPVSESAEVYFKRGLLASKLSRPRSEVVDNFKNAIVLDSGRADFIARYGEELYRNQTKKRVGEDYVLEAKSYFKLVMEQYDKNHVRSNYYMGKIMLREWDKQSNRRPYDKLHKLATGYFQNVIRHNGALEFPETYFNLGNIMRDRQINGLANEMYSKYLETYQRSTGKQSPKLRYVRDLMRKR